jgi:hypothetical protein
LSGETEEHRENLRIVGISVEVPIGELPNASLERYVKLLWEILFYGFQIRDSTSVCKDAVHILKTIADIHGTGSSEEYSYKGKQEKDVIVLRRTGINM